MHGNVQLADTGQLVALTMTLADEAAKRVTRRSERSSSRRRAG